jgi:hypothetical protein
MFKEQKDYSLKNIIVKEMPNRVSEKNVLHGLGVIAELPLKIDLYC